MAKMNPNYANFFGKATAAGFGTNEIISFMQNLFENPAAKSYKNNLSEGMSKGTLRPDETESVQSIHQSEGPERFLKGAARTASVLGGAGYAASQAPGLIKKGLGALSSIAGISPKKSEQQQNPAEEEPQGPGGFEEFIRQNPELGSYLDELILKKGMSPQQAAMEAKKRRKFMPAISDIESKVGQKFEDLLGQLFEGFKGQQKPKGNQGGERKTQFLQGLNQLGSLLQGLKGGR
jgi:hypothetical protein